MAEEETKPEKKMINCESCGEPFITEKMLERLRKKEAVVEAVARLCQDCRRKRLAESMVELAHADKQ